MEQNVVHIVTFVRQTGDPDTERLFLCHHKEC
jgi:hypothetical protein